MDSKMDSIERLADHRIGRMRTRAARSSTVTRAPASSDAPCSVRTRTTRFPIVTGKTFCVRTCTTLGPRARVSASRFRSRDRA
jgi:hypothetical protein